LRSKLSHLGRREWVEAEVGAKAGPIVSIHNITIILMDYDDIRAHQTHLQEKDGVVGTDVGKNETNCAIVGNPPKTLTKKHMAVLVYCSITRESLAQMRVQSNLVATATMSTKCDRVTDSRGSLCHKTEVRSGLIGIHGLSQSNIICGLAYYIAKSL
jgi:hypothetical protein